MTPPENIDRALNHMWQKIPNEERVLLLAQARARGIEACLLCGLLACALAASLRMQWVLLAALGLLPLIFQVVSRQAWLSIKPLTVIRYFLASVSSSFFAQKLRSQDPSLKLIFRGTLESVPLDQDGNSEEEFSEELAAERPRPQEVWVSLFPDSLVMISENDAGARLEFGHSTLQDFAVAVDAPEDQQGGSTASRLFIQTTKGDEVTSRYILSSPHTTTLLACERKIRFFNQRASERAVATR